MYVCMYLYHNSLGTTGALPSLNSASRASTGPSRARRLYSSVQHCRECARCGYVSFSRSQKKCSWFEACDTARLQNDVWGFRTVHVERGSLNMTLT